jgi:hypothetical protein
MPKLTYEGQRTYKEKVARPLKTHRGYIEPLVTGEEPKDSGTNPRLRLRAAKIKESATKQKKGGESKKSGWSPRR